MFGGLNRLLVAALVAAAFFVAPSAALACGGGPSAVNVYKPCLPTGGGGKHAGGGKGGGTQTSSGPSSGSTRVVIPKQTVAALKRAGKDGQSLSQLVKGYRLRRLLSSAQSTTAATEPTAIGSAFDLGSGPTALLIVLAGTAVLLLGGSSLRLWRGRRRA